MKKEKSRKPFLYFFIVREMTAFFVAAIIMLLAVYGLYYVFIETVKNADLEQIEILAEKPFSTASEYDKTNIDVINNMICFGTSVKYEVSGSNSMTWFEDSQTGETVADSDRRLFLLLRENEGDPLITYTCDADSLGDKWNKYDSVNCEKKRVLFKLNGTDYVEVENLIDFLKKDDFEYYAFELHDVYLKGSEFVPGKVDVYRESGLFETFDRNFVCTIDFTPKDAESYTHIDEKEYENLCTHLFLTLGSNKKVNRAKLKADLAADNGEECEYYFTNEDSPFPGQITMICRKECADDIGRNLIIYRYSERYFYNDCRLFLQIIALALGIIAFLAGLLVARKKYLENKYFCDMNEYRKCLMDSMAHDLRSPLTVMGGYAQNLMEDVNGEKRQYYADSIVKNVEYMDKIIADNLTLSKLSAEEVEKDRQKVDLVKKLEELFEIYKPALQERRVETVFEGNFIKKVNPTSIDSALVNIVSNAEKYVNPEGKIHVYVKGKNLIVSNTTDETFEGKINDLWKPFVKGDKSRGNEKGTGLGLAIAKRVLDVNKLKASLKYDEESKTFMVIIG